MSTIVTRAGKGSPLTWNEVDNNFTNLNTDKFQSGSNISVGTLSASGVSTFSAGSAGAPALTTTGDTNTGIFFPAADTIAFSEGGAEAMRIDSAGNVGIGTANPTTKIMAYNGSSRTLIRAASDLNFSGAYLGTATATNRGASLELLTHADSNNAGGWKQQVAIDTSNDDLTFSYSGAASTYAGLSYTEKMRITGAGGVSFGSSGTAYGTTGQVLTSNGNAAPTWTTPSANGGGLGGMQSFASSGTFTIPTGKTSVKITVVGGGGGGGQSVFFPTGPGGGAGGAAIKVFTGLTAGATLTVTIGGGGSIDGAGGTTSVTSGTQSITTIQATGGSSPNYQKYGGIGGSGSGGTANLRGEGGGQSAYIYVPCAGETWIAGIGGNSIFGGGIQRPDQSALTGGGGIGRNYQNSAQQNAVAGGSGIVIFEW